MVPVLQFIGFVIIVLVGVVSGSVLLDRAFNGETYVREAREKAQKRKARAEGVKP